MSRNNELEGGIGIFSPTDPHFTLLNCEKAEIMGTFFHEENAYRAYNAAEQSVALISPNGDILLMK